MRPMFLAENGGEDSRPTGMCSPKNKLHSTPMYINMFHKKITI